MCFLRSLLLLFSLLSITHAAAVKAETEITWLGHAAFKIVTPTGKVLLLDPWILNPTNPTAVKDYAAIKKADLILISHGHHNHIGDAPELARRTGAKVVASPTLKRALIQNRQFDRDQFTSDAYATIGHTLSFFGGEVKITLGPADHHAVSEHEEDAKMRNNAAYAGAYSFIIEISNGPTLFHTGDTDFFDEIEEVGKRFRIDAMLVCIGGKFTMDPEEAAEAVSLVKPKVAIPMHYGSVEGMTGTPAMFQEELNKLKLDVKMLEIKPGTSAKL